MSTTNNTPDLTAAQLRDLIDGAFPVKARCFQLSRDPYTLFYNPSRMEQKNDGRLREWSVAEIKKLKAIVNVFGFSVRIGEASGPSFWPIIHSTAE